MERSYTSDTEIRNYQRPEKMKILIRSVEVLSLFLFSLGQITVKQFYTLGQAVPRTRATQALLRACCQQARSYSSGIPLLRRYIYMPPYPNTSIYPSLAA